MNGIIRKVIDDKNIYSIIVLYLFLLCVDFSSPYG